MELTQYTQYILWGGAILIALVVLHGLWLNLRGRLERRAHAKAVPRPPAEQLNMNLDVGLQDESGDGDFAIGEEPPTERSMAGDGSAPLDDSPSQPAATRRGRRIPVAGRRTEPTVPRKDREPENGNARGRSTLLGRDAESDPVADVIVIWVLAKDGRAFDGENLLRVFKANGLSYAGNVFRKLDPNTRRQLFSVANGVEPGTFDLSDMATLSTPRVVFLLRLAALKDPAPAFEGMLDAAQDVAATLNGEIKDERKSDFSIQTIEHCRQRIRDFKRMNLQQ